ncbi:MAG: acyltransferase [Gemmatimonadetes bacterium]|jgi:1-acyl-sn-glycerol-3-phosphate acyltransferase|nr:acyltransferase [Gemmatimonadota bacterium]
MRTWLTGLTVAVMTILLAPVAVAAHVLRLSPEERRVQQWCMRTWARSVLRAGGVRVVLHGAEHASRTRGAVYASNHVSWFDIFALASVLPRYTFVAKAELRRIPIFGWGAEGAGVVFLSRENRKSAFAAYEGVASEIARGCSVVVCPEGTRGDDYHLRPFKKGPFVLAIGASAPVVPTVVHGAREVMSRRSWRVRSGTVHVHLLPAVETAGYDYDQRHDVMTRVWTAMAGCLAAEYGVVTDERAIAPA